MKKFLHIILTALAVLPFVACQEEEEVFKPEVKDITVISVRNLVFLPAGGSGAITVDCASSFTATSDKSWCTVSVSGNEVTVTATANLSNESRYATILMKTAQSSQSVVVEQLGEVLDGMALEDRLVPQKGETFLYGYSSNLSVSMSSDQDWVHFEMIDDEKLGKMVKVTVDENKGFGTRFATVSYNAGSKSGSAVITQEPSYGTVSGWKVEDTGGEFVFPDQFDMIAVTPPAEMASTPYYWLLVDPSELVGQDIPAAMKDLADQLMASANAGEVTFTKGSASQQFQNLPSTATAVIVCFDDRNYPTGQYALVDVAVPDRGPVKPAVDGWEVTHTDGVYAYPAQTDQFVITPKAGYEDVKYIATVVKKESVTSVEDFAFTNFAMSTREDILAKVASGELASFEDGLTTGTSTLTVDNKVGDVYVVIVAFGDNQFYTGDYAAVEMNVVDLMPTYYKWLGKWTLTGKNIEGGDYTETIEFSIDETDVDENGNQLEGYLVVRGLCSKNQEAAGVTPEMNVDAMYVIHDKETGALTFYGQNGEAKFTNASLGADCRLQLISMYVKANATSYTNVTGGKFISVSMNEDGNTTAITALERSAGLPYKAFRMRCLNAAGSAYTIGDNSCVIAIDENLTLTRLVE